MAAKKKTKKMEIKLKTTAGKEVVPMKKAIQRKPNKRRVTPKKNLANKRAAPRKTEVKTKGNVAGARTKQGQGKSQSVDTVPNLHLGEEGNAFEAEAVKGVEDAGDADEGEVCTHEVPQDDVPGEYPDKE